MTTAIQPTIEDFLDALMTGGVPNAADTREAVRQAINALGVGAAFSASTIRDGLPPYAQRPQIGAFVNRLRRRGFIARDGYAVNTTHFEGDEDGNVQFLHLVEVEFKEGRFEPKPGTERKIPAQLVTLAMGFTGTDVKNGLVEQLGLELDARGNVARDAHFATNVDGVFVAGDAGRGQSLIVWAIAEGRAAAAGVDRYLMGHSALPAPIKPTAVPQR